MLQNSKPLRKILFIQTAFLGDVLLTIPALRKLRSLHPEAEITLITRKGLGQILQKLGIVTAFFEVEKNNAKTYELILQTLKSETFDLLITPHESIRTGIFAWKIKATKKIGPKTFWNFLFFDQCVKKKKWLPEPLRVLQFCNDPTTNAQENFEAEDYANAFYRIENHKLTFDTTFATMSCREEILRWAEFEKMRGIYGIHPQRVLMFPGSVWETKKYPADRYLDVAKSLIGKGFEVVLMGAKNEEALGLHIQKGMSSPVVNLIGKTNLAESLCLMALSGCVLGNDSGSAHLASVAGCPSVTIFGPTIVEFGYRPWSNQSAIAQTSKKLSCRPCGSHGHKACPIGTHECMTSIAPSDVLDIVNGVMS